MINGFAVDQVLYAVDLLFRQVFIAAGGKASIDAKRHSASLPAGACTLMGERYGYPEVLAVTSYILFAKHVVGQWAADVGAEASDLVAYKDGVANQYVHGFVWHKMLTSAAGERASPEMVRRLAEVLCCRACKGAECNAECASTAEGDWYHACFHGVGHGSVLLALHHEGRLASYGKCTATRWLSQKPSPKSMLDGEAGCEAAAVGSRRNRKYCLLGVYMSYFEYLEPVASEWASACDGAACPAACIIKCRQFASQLFDPILFIPVAWPANIICYGQHPLSEAQAAALDETLTVYGARSIYHPGHGEQYTPQLESWLLETVRENATRATAAGRSPLPGGCF